MEVVLGLPLAFGFGSGWEILVVLVVALLLFGKRLPEVMRSMGRGIVEFKKGVRGIEEEISEHSSSSPPKPVAGSESSQSPAPSTPKDE